MSYELTDRQKIICGMAVGQWGCNAQMKKVAEELRELADAIGEWMQNPLSPAAMANLVDERADVAVMLFQFDSALTTTAMRDDVDKRIGVKLERLAQRVHEVTVIRGGRK